MDEHESQYAWLITSIIKCGMKLLIHSKNPSVIWEWIRNFDLQRTIIIGLSPRHQCHHGDKIRDANIQFSKFLMILRYNQTKSLIYDEMVKILSIFCLISPIYFAYIKQKWRFEGPKWVMIKQLINGWHVCKIEGWGTTPDTCHICDPLSLSDAIL